MSNDIQSRFDEVKVSYIKNLKEKDARIQYLWNKLQKNWHPEAFDELHRIVHSLAGGAETFGFSEISSVARKAVNLIRDKEDLIPLDQHEDVLELDRMLTNLNTTIKKILKINSN